MSTLLSAGLSAGVACVLPHIAHGDEFPPEIAKRHAAAVAYIEEHANREEMVMTPMRDGIRLSSLILFPKGQPRENLPAVLIYNPYLTKGMVDRFSEYVASFLK
ncbi:MAG: hypothetical protein WBP90_14680, partial [Terracidiphilus sp.]